MDTARSICCRAITLIAVCILLISPWAIYRSPDWIRQASDMPVGDARLITESAAGDPQAIFESLSSGIDVNFRTDTQSTPLHFAVMSGNVRAVHELLVAHADVDAMNSDGVTPLSLAVSQREDSIAAVLLKAGADPNQGAHRGLTPLYMASLQGDSALVEMLLHAGAQLNARTESGMTALIGAVNAYDNGCDTLKQLLIAGADPNLAEPDGSTPLMEAAQRGDAEAVILLLRYGADPARLNHSGHNARMLAEQGQYWRVAAMLPSARNHRQA